MYGDDFVPMGYISQVKWFEAELKKHWVIQSRGVLGPPGYHDCVQSIRIVGRIVEWTSEGITWEADPRHAEIVCNSYAISSKAVATPGVKDKADDIESENALGQTRAEKYRANTMRCQYLSVYQPIDQRFKLLAGS